MANEALPTFEDAGTFRVWKNAVGYIAVDPVQLMGYGDYHQGIEKGARLTDHLEMGEGKVHVWLASLPAYNTPARIDECIALLSDEELCQYRQFALALPRTQYVVTRAAVRWILSRYFPVSPKKWKFNRGQWGRPFICDGLPDGASISFNVSHTSGWIAVAISCESTVGIDIEHVVDSSQIDIAKRFFAPSEIAALLALPQEMQKMRFFELWTLKESYIKATGRGLAVPLDKVAFSLTSHDGIDVTVDGKQDDAWSFTLACPVKEAPIALCVPCMPRPFEVVTRMFVPLDLEYEVGAAVYRRSAHPVCRSMLAT